MIDEGHKICNSLTLAWRCLKLIDAPIKLVITATPAVYEIKQLGGLLRFVYEKGRAKQIQKDDQNLYRDDAEDSDSDGEFEIDEDEQTFTRAEAKKLGKNGAKCVKFHQKYTGVKLLSAISKLEKFDERRYYALNPDW